RAGPPRGLAARPPGGATRRRGAGGQQRAQARHALPAPRVVPHPLAPRYVVGADANESLPLEELLRMLVDGAGEDEVESQRLGLLHDARHQPVAQSLSLEAVDGVETDDLAGALLPVGRREETGHPCQVAAAHRDAEAGAQNPGDLVGGAQLEHILPRAPLEQPLRLLVLVERERADARVVSLGEERARTGVAEELLGHTPRRAEVHLL